MTKHTFALICSLGLYSFVYGQPTEPMFVEIPAGRFFMGSAEGGIHYDEMPVHKVHITKPFRMMTTEVTNAMYEAFDPGHKKIRGKNGFSVQDDEAVVYVSYNDALRYCQWLSEKNGKHYRLPTEAEWEYACRAGSFTNYTSGQDLPKLFFKEQQTSRIPKPVSLAVAQTPANRFGLYDMHGGVEELCSDRYGRYKDEEQYDPTGAADGYAVVVRGGSHNTPLTFLRSASRSAVLPDDRQWITGFRVVEADPLPLSVSTVNPQPQNQRNVSQKHRKWGKPIGKPYFARPKEFVIEPTDGFSKIFEHNHCPAVSWLPNGDLLAIWFSCNAESGREMTILASRLRAGKTEWEPASEFFRVADRNLTGSALLLDNEGVLYHFNGVEVSGDWLNLAVVMRTSRDNGATWSLPEIISPEHGAGNQVIAGPILTSDGKIVLACDAVAESHGGTVLHIGEKRGNKYDFHSPNRTKNYSRNPGEVIAGIHASVVELRDGSLMAFGRGDHQLTDNKEERMPCSISSDGGKTWRYSPTPFHPVGGGQRLVLRRLSGGELLFVGFSDYNAYNPDGKNEGILIRDKAGNAKRGYGMYACISKDDGKSWSTPKLISDSEERYLDGGAWTKGFLMNDSLAEPRAYLCCTESPDKIIHLLSSKLHYAFNLEWLLE